MYMSLKELDERIDREQDMKSEIKSDKVLVSYKDYKFTVEKQKIGNYIITGVTRKDIEGEYQPQDSTKAQTGETPDDVVQILKNDVNNIFVQIRETKRFKKKLEEKYGELKEKPKELKDKLP